jgi:YesN/AraC family two-component response regulator
MRLMAEKPDILISDLVFMTGFNDRAYFYRTFQKITGKTIREYRDSLWNTHMK